MSYKSLFTTVGLLVVTIFQASAQPSVPPGAIEIDLDAATSHFKEMFARTCYKQRHSLRSFVTDRPSLEFFKVERQYPVRDEEQGATLLAEWGTLTRSGPHLVGLYHNDSNPGVFACVLRAVAVRKETLKDAMLRIDELYVAAEKEENETQITGFMHKKEPNLRVLCMTPTAVNPPSADCHLWSWPETGS